MSQVRILVAEDDLDHQRLLQLLLHRVQPDSVIDCVATGSDLIERLREAKFDCVLLDFNLPDYRADELLPQLNEIGVDCPIIVISSGNDQEVVIQSMRSGGDDFIPKSKAIDGDMLWGRIEVAMNKWKEAARARQQIERRVQRLSKLAEKDPLTGLSNRLGLERALNGRRNTLDRRGRSSCIMLDLDHFKQINDKHGHPAGDLVLQELGSLLLDSVRYRDLVCRWGGEEFLAIIPGTTLGEGLVWAELFRRKVESMELTYRETPLRVTISIGVANCRSSVFDKKTIEHADQALYLAKHNGRNRTCSWHEVEINDRLTRWIQPDGEERRDRVETRFNQWLHAAADLLGAVQYQHLTSHSHQVAQLAYRMGREIGLCGEDLLDLRLAGLLHDLGKLYVPEELLTKTTPLSDIERYLISRHAAEGAQAAEHLGANSHVRELIHFHHAHFDGSRGSDGKIGYAIPIGARIISVADAFSAMTSHRPFHTPRTREEALIELLRHRGRQFDPQVVEAACKTFLSEESTHLEAVPS